MGFFKSLGRALNPMNAPGVKKIGKTIAKGPPGMPKGGIPGLNKLPAPPGLNKMLPPGIGQGIQNMIGGVKPGGIAPSAIPPPPPSMIPPPVEVPSGNEGVTPNAMPPDMMPPDMIPPEPPPIVPPQQPQMMGLRGIADQIRRRAGGIGPTNLPY